MIKQFNFYDIYGYLLPGMLLLGIFWLPIGVLTKSWPDQDLSKAVFLAGLAYVLGHLVQSVAMSLVPSKIKDLKGNQRVPSDIFLDQSDTTFNGDFKERLSSQIQNLFGLSIDVDHDGDGKNKASANRRTAFYQARSFLIAKKAANYVEQFEGLYAMMRGLGSSFCVGAMYLAGWCIAYFAKCNYVAAAMDALTAIAIVGIVISVWPRSKLAKGLAPVISWLGAFLGLGFWVSFLNPKEFWLPTPLRAELVLLGSVAITLLAATKCFASYRIFAGHFAETVWRDFSACLSYQVDAAKPPQEVNSSAGNDSDEE